MAELSLVPAMQKPIIRVPPLSQAISMPKQAFTYLTSLSTPQKVSTDEFYCKKI